LLHDGVFHIYLRINYHHIHHSYSKQSVGGQLFETRHDISSRRERQCRTGEEESYDGTFDVPIIPREEMNNEEGETNFEIDQTPACGG
jgi:hypothetical protein